MQISEGQQRILLDIARTAIRRALLGEEHRLPEVDDELMRMPAGCFVSLHEQGTHRLRGCVGRLQSADPLLKSIYETAVGVLSDPRFGNSPIHLADLPRLDLEISVLSPLRLATHPLDFEPLEDGIYLTIGGRSGTFLPQVARQTGWGREQLLSRLCSEKMGLAAMSWQGADAKLWTYRAVVIGPVEFGGQPEFSLEGAEVKIVRM